MSYFTVIEIIDGDTIKVSPKWTWNGKEGDTVKILGYSTPLANQQLFAISKLSDLIKSQQVELKDPQIFSEKSSAIASKVYYNGVDISKYFPEFQRNKPPYSSYET